MTLSVSFGKEMANDDAVAARIGDFCGVLAGLHYVGDLLGAQLRDHLRRQFILEWQRRLERGDELTSFLALRGLAPATSLDARLRFLGHLMFHLASCALCFRK